MFEVSSKEQSASEAERWLTLLYERVHSLRAMPNRCGLIRENEAFGQEVRELLHFSHRIIFAVDEDRSLVLVHAVRHAARDEMQGGEFQSTDGHQEPTGRLKQPALDLRVPDRASTLPKRRSFSTLYGLSDGSVPIL